MGFISYVLIGGIAYALGWGTRTYILDKKPAPEQPYHLRHPVIMQCLAIFFVAMLIVSWLLGKFVMGHPTADIPFILMNSLVATFVFSFGVNPDKVRYDLPD